MTVYTTAEGVNAPRVALLGTGTMGAGMARNIATAGLPLAVWNRSPERAAPLAEAGARVASDVADAVRDADVVVTMLWDADVVAEVLQEARGRFAEGAVLLQTSTVGIEGHAALRDVAGDLGLRYVDAPVLGTKHPAEQGTLVVLASGPDDTRPVVAPVLDAIGSRTVWLGDRGDAASRLKLAANAFVLNVTAAIAESRAITGALGLDPDLFLEAIRGGPLESPFVTAKGRLMTAGDYPAAFAVDGGLKDARFIVGSAGATAPLTAVTVERLAALSAAGHGDEDIAALARPVGP
ncbi:NAD(P)-dependent oxidoreductase [Nocardioides caldifontis]|uniref:NAD(P)-dependent oxidoreductase n=1 Tax=Nocardioides caldifontis TaxID=2588938 RepID=UPI0011DF2BF1|nr:NAD(P)-dependent oxidoreductase [Nocardioides caldifontis]